jgi:hypothetical protein
MVDLVGPSALLAYRSRRLPVALGSCSLTAETANVGKPDLAK